MTRWPRLPSVLHQTGQIPLFFHRDNHQTGDFSSQVKWFPDGIYPGFIAIYIYLSTNKLEKKFHIIPFETMTCRLVNDRPLVKSTLVPHFSLWLKRVKLGTPMVRSTVLCFGDPYVHHRDSGGCFIWRAGIIDHYLPSGQVTSRHGKSTIHFYVYPFMPTPHVWWEKHEKTKCLICQLSIFTR